MKKIKTLCSYTLTAFLLMCSMSLLAQPTIDLQGPTTTCLNSTDSYSLTTAGYYPYFTALDVTVTLTGGVFTSNSSNVKTFPAGTVAFDIKWTTLGQGNVLMNVRIQSSNGSIGYTTPKNVPVSVVANLVVAPPIITSATTTFKPNNYYQFTISANASQIEWSVEGDASVYYQNGKTFWIQTASYFGTALVKCRTFNCGAWTNWTTYNVVGDCTAPIPTLTDNANGSVLCPNKSYTFTATAAGTSGYIWSVAGNATIQSQSGGTLVIYTGSTSSNVTVSVQGKRCTNISTPVTANKTINAAVPSNINISENSGRSTLCPAAFYTFYANASNASAYEWFVSGDAYIQSTSGNTVRIGTYDNFSTMNVTCIAKNQCASNSASRRYDRGAECCVQPSGSIGIREVGGATYFCNGGLYTLEVTGPTANSYTWTETGTADLWVLSTNGSWQPVANGTPITTTSNTIKIKANNDITLVYPSTAKWTSINVSASYCVGTKTATKGYSTSCSLRTEEANTEESDEEATSTILSPNPVASGTMAILQLAKADLVSEVQLYDAQGHLIRTIAAVDKNAVEISTSGLSSGLYTLRLMGAYTVKNQKLNVY